MKQLIQVGLILAAIASSGCVYVLPQVVDCPNTPEPEVLQTAEDGHLIAPDGCNHLIRDSNGNIIGQTLLWCGAPLDADVTLLDRNSTFTVPNF